MIRRLAGDRSKAEHTILHISLILLLNYNFNTFVSTLIILLYTFITA